MRKNRSGVVLSIVGSIIALLLFFFVNHGDAGNPDCYHVGQATSGQPVTCYSPTQYHLAWAFALALLVIGAFLQWKSKGGGDTK